MNALKHSHTHTHSGTHTHRRGQGKSQRQSRSRSRESGPRRNRADRVQLKGAVHHFECNEKTQLKIGKSTGGGDVGSGVVVGDVFPRLQ